MSLFTSVYQTKHFAPFSQQGLAKNSKNHCDIGSLHQLLNRIEELTFNPDCIHSERVQLCGICQQSNHNRRMCPQNSGSAQLYMQCYIVMLCILLHLQCYWRKLSMWFHCTIGTDETKDDLRAPTKCILVQCPISLHLIVNLLLCIFKVISHYFGLYITKVSISIMPVYIPFFS